ncbi:deoxyribodipyrimidine photo-lyase [Candidatus Peribacteria bacterium]|nr:deoxyribodipyrimidine photo-lyase [Candidatus Peribacteria bacterium]
MKYHRSLFVFRQDLRIHDNTALNLALTQSEEVLPIFIYDERSQEEFGKEDRRFGFIREMLERIDSDLRKHG